MKELLFVVDWSVWDEIREWISVRLSQHTKEGVRENLEKGLL